MRTFGRFRWWVAALAVCLMATGTVAQGGLPGEYVITDRWRHVCSMHSGVTNPAYVSEENYMSLRFAFANTLEEFYMHEAGFTMPLGFYDAIGVTWMMQSVAPYNLTDVDGNETGSTVVDQAHFFALTYAHNVWDRLTVGGNVNIIAQSIANIDGERVGNTMQPGFGVDVGLTWKVLRHQTLGNHILGFSTNNIVNTILNTDEKYAAAVRFSLLSDFWENGIYYGADFVLKNLFSVDGDWDLLKEGAGKNMPWEFSQKLGFSIYSIFKFYALFGFSSVEGGFDHYGFAFGANMAKFFNGRDIEGMIQYVSIVGSNDASHISFYARTEFGKRKPVLGNNQTGQATGDVISTKYSVEANIKEKPPVIVIPFENL